MGALRATEEDMDFQAGLVRAQAEAGETSGYSKTNFAYGSTPYQVRLQTGSGLEVEA